MALWEIPHVIFTFKKEAFVQVCVPLILQRLRQEDYSEFKESLDYIVTDEVSPNLKNGDNNNNNNKGKRRKKKKKM